MNAIEKINAEMQKNPDDLYTEIIGHYIIDRCLDASVASKVAAEGKTLKGAMDAIYEKAKKAKKGNVAVLLPSDVFGTVDQYFGIATDVEAQQKAMMPGGGSAAPVPKQHLALNMEDFLV